MAWIPRTITAIGIIFLVHAGYSAQEYAASSSSGIAQSLAASPLVSKSLPFDVRAEAIIATIVTVIGLVLNSPKLRPIRWNVWAGKIEREGAAGFLDGGGRVDKDFRGNPFAVLETRPGFVDIRKQRREFADWARGQKNE